MTDDPYWAQLVWFRSRIIRALGTPLIVVISLSSFVVAYQTCLEVNQPQSTFQDCSSSLLALPWAIRSLLYTWICITLLLLIRACYAILCEGQTTHTDESLSRTYTQIKGQSVNILIVASFSTVVVVYQSLLEVRPRCKAYTKLLRGLVCPKAIPLTFLQSVLSCWHLVVMTLTRTNTSKAWSNCFWASKLWQSKSYNLHRSQDYMPQSPSEVISSPGPPITSTNSTTVIFWLSKFWIRPYCSSA